jgi:hypothetical protein
VSDHNITKNEARRIHREYRQAAGAAAHGSALQGQTCVSRFAHGYRVGRFVKEIYRPTHLPSRWQMPTDLTLVPLWRSLAFRKYHSACGAVVSAQLWKSVNARNGSGEAHCLAARKADMVRFDVFLGHQPQCTFFNRAARCSKENTNPLARDEARG